MDAVVGLGANLGEPRAAFNGALTLLRSAGQLVAVAPLYGSPALGPAQPDFTNSAVRLHTDLRPAALLALLLDIERAAGRVRRERWGPRVLDLDLLLVAGEVVSTPELEVPHPGLLLRPFALRPLLDVFPGALDPRTGIALQLGWIDPPEGALRRLADEWWDSQNNPTSPRG